MFVRKKIVWSGECKARIERGACHDYGRRREKNDSNRKTLVKQTHTTLPYHTILNTCFV